MSSDGADRRLRSRTSSWTGSQKSAGQSSQPRLASKRAALDDGRAWSSGGSSSSSAVTALSQGKKRAALSSLSNSANVPAMRATVTPKSQIVVTKPKSRGLHEKKASKKVSKPVVKAVAIESVPDKSDSVAEVGVENLESPAVKADPQAVLSLERKTVQSLYISREPKETELQQGVASSNSIDALKDIDAGIKDPQMCGLYATDIYQHLRMAELKRRPSTNFMEFIQQDINPGMRGILVDWLVEVAEEYKLVPDTLYLTVSYIDRFLSANVVSRQRLQLLGVSCMLIASKYEEICAPQVEEFCYITDNTYSKSELVDMERQVLCQLRFELTTPTIKTFIRRFMRAAQAAYQEPSLQLEFLGNYLAELSLVEYSFLKYMPSMIAASAVFLARLTHNPAAKPWDATLSRYTRYKASELSECVADMYDLQRNIKGCGLPATREKYKQHKFKCVSSLQPPVLAPEHFQDDV
ncbi:hypothetical protein SELMODRAFT_412891 [Selaginella moellendorffii]|uniref:Uncharacterized protein CYCA2-1 n=1 Tax=Selaginella moellendorffii TaxID=88036 RepID=D8RMN6_SELML|nr:cyclin-A1-4 [Selaginella moellendorffii]EFJ26371.1 hypothetical protein SELMODRAFT_412891 [Selaginella moellendorffii]|eukprot:XP_002972285.1 cyclin-A1-4 [Selaginella moellendorffii]